MNYHGQNYGEEDKDLLILYLERPKWTRINNSLDGNFNSLVQVEPINENEIGYAIVPVQYNSFYSPCVSLSINESIFIASRGQKNFERLGVWQQMTPSLFNFRMFLLRQGYHKYLQQGKCTSKISIDTSLSKLSLFFSIPPPLPLPTGASYSGRLSQGASGRMGPRPMSAARDPLAGKAINLPAEMMR